MCAGGRDMHPKVLGSQESLMLKLRTAGHCVASIRFVPRGQLYVSPCAFNSGHMCNTVQSNRFLACQP
jgi:hypothetical protein